MLNWDGSADRLILWHESAGVETVTDGGDDRGRKRARHARPAAQQLSGGSAFLFSRVFLKTVPVVGPCGALFGLDDTAATRYLVTQLRFQSSRLDKLFPFPSKERIMETVPPEYKATYGPMVAGVLDCSDLSTDKPSDPSIAKAMHNIYYGHYGGKWLAYLFHQPLLDIPSSLAPPVLPERSLDRSIVEPTLLHDRECFHPPDPLHCCIITGVQHSQPPQCCNTMLLS